MKAVVVYCYPIGPAGNFLPNAVRFLHSYHERPPGIEHDTVIVCNGSPPDDETRFLFGSLPNVEFLYHDNSGWDIGAHQMVAAIMPADMMVFFGANVYIRHSNWLKRSVEVFDKYGDDVYGYAGSGPDARANVWAHVRTECFFCSPSLMNKYPVRVTHNGLRYPFEHGENSFTQWALKDGRRAWIVSTESVYPLHYCDYIPGGYHNGNQETLLVGDRHSQHPFWHCE